MINLPVFYNFKETFQPCSIVFNIFIQYEHYKNILTSASWIDLTDPIPFVYLLTQLNLFYLLIQFN